MWGGRTLAGMDCYGLCLELARRDGVILPDAIWAEAPEEIEKIVNETELKGFTKADKPQPGDLVGFMLRPPFVSHIGYMVSEYEFIHVTKGTRVTRERLDSLQWNRKIAGFYRWIK